MLVLSLSKDYGPGTKDSLSVLDSRPFLEERLLHRPE